MQANRYYCTVIYFLSSLIMKSLLTLLACSLLVGCSWNWKTPTTTPVEPENTEVTTPVEDTDTAKQDTPTKKPTSTTPEQPEKDSVKTEEAPKEEVSTEEMTKEIDALIDDIMKI